MKAAASLVVAAALVFGCGGESAKAPVAPAATPLIVHGTDLVPAGGLRWMLSVDPRPFLAVPELALTLRTLDWDRRATAFAKNHASLDPRTLRELVVADFGRSTLFVGLGSLDPREVEAQFAAGVLVRGRAVRPLETGTEGLAFPVTRTWGEGPGDEPQELVVLGPFGAVVEIGRGSHARAAEAFLRGQLRKAAPALRAAPLDHAEGKVGDAPVRVFAPGPFDGAWSRGLGGALASVGACVLGARPLAVKEGSRAGLEVTVTLLPLDPAASPVAAQNLEDLYGRLARSPLGHMAKLDRPLRPPAAIVDPDGAVTLTVTVDGAELLLGLHRALEADVPEMMGSLSDPPRAR